MSKQKSTTLRLAILISGGGRTLKNLLDQQADGSLPINVRLVISSTKRASGLQHARNAAVPTEVFSRRETASDKEYGARVFAACRAAEVDYVVMAGFLKLVPLPDDFAGRVLNIHPSLIPAFCGHGMYGHHVHQAVLDYGAKVTGCTIHFVDNEYDRGPIIWQQPVPVFDDDNADTLAARVFEAEQEAYPHVLKLLAAGKISLKERHVRISPR